MMKLLRAPRSVFVNFPLGHQCGKPNNTEMQLEILKDALNFLVSAREPGGMLELSYDWGESFGWNDYKEGVQKMLEEHGSEKQEWNPEK